MILTNATFVVGKTARMALALGNADKLEEANALIDRPHRDIRPAQRSISAT